MISRLFNARLLLISVSFFITFCSSSENKSSLVFDVSEYINNLTYSEDKIDASIQHFMENNTHPGRNQPPTLYYEHIFHKGTFNFTTAVKRINQLQLPYVLLINLKATAFRENELYTTTFVKQRYSEIFRIVAQNTLISGVSIEFIDARNTCLVNQQATNKSLIEEVREISRSFTLRDLKVGYELSFIQLKCKEHSLFIQNSEYLIINIPFKRNNKDFVESLAAFKTNMKNISIHAKVFVDALFGGNYTSPIYYKVSLSKNLNLENTGVKRCREGIVTSHGQSFIKMASENFANVQEEYVNRYENLLAQYCRQLGLEREDVAFILKIPLENSDAPKALEIPRMPSLPIMGLRTLGMRSISFLLEEIGSSGFNTILINGDIWKEMISKGISNFNCYNSKCRPENVWYLNDRDYAFSKYNKNNITNLLEFDGMQLRALIFSRYYKDNSQFNWQQATTSLKQIANSTVRIETGCNEIADFFDEILNNETLGIYCHMLQLQRTLGCGSLGLSSKIIVWRGVLVFKVYEVNDFVENTITKLDALVLGRQILKNVRKRNGQYGSVEIVLRIAVDYEGEGKAVIGNHMYCTNLSAIVYQFYEILLTWANIHDFTIILDPVQGYFGYDNPISWKRLEIASDGRLHNLMHKFPIFIRRSYNTSRVFGSWTSGMYPCIQRSNHLDSIKELNFMHSSTGAIIYTNVKSSNTNISTEELQIILLFAFGKFSTVEVIIRSQLDLEIFYDTVQQPNFSLNLRANKILGKKVYIDLRIIISHQVIKIITKIMKILENNYIQVEIHYSNVQKADLFGFKTGTLIQNCTETAHGILASHYDIFDRIRSAKYIVCDTSPKAAQNEDLSSMRDYLDSHLYLQKLFKYFFRNLTGVYFRLHPYLVGNTFEEQSQNLLLFLADIHKYATAYDINYFLLLVLPIENEEKMASFWALKSNESLLDINNFIERQATLLGLANWKPQIGNYVDFNMPTISTLPVLPTVTESSQVWDSSTTITNLSYVNPNQLSLSTVDYTLIFLGSLAVFVIIIFLVVLLITRRHILRKRIYDFCNLTKPSENGALEVIEYNKNNRKYSKNINQTETMVRPKSEIPISKNYHKILKDNIEIYYDKILGSGQFGIVYRAILKDTLVEVAVKMIHDDSPQESLKGMWSEVNLLCGIGNQCNVVRFIGCYYEDIQKGVLWIITELCTQGSLLSFLRDVEAEKIDVRLSRRELLKFCLEVAQGMEYIWTKDIIHGDLSTRNVLLDENYTCKIGDFGLSRKLYRYEMYVKQGQEPLPWRWMAYESLTKMQFSTQSDVWSYGVTMWEIFTLGNVPYPGMSWSFDFLAEIENGLRLPIPKHATRNINAMIQQCWELKPKERPSFTELVKFFSNQLERNCDDDDKIIRM